MLEAIGSKYWDLFEQRIDETHNALRENTLPPLRRLSLHITNKCNMKCSYCNECHSPKQLSKELFFKLIKEYSQMGGGILHITGGEPTCVPYLFDVIRDTVYYDNVDIHLNTNLMTNLPDDVIPRIKRLKVSLDSHDAEYFDSLVGIPNAHQLVMKNLKKINELNSRNEGPIVSITYTMTRENYKHIPNFLEMYYKELPHLYAVFFSAYKGTNERFTFTPTDIGSLFDEIVPILNHVMESAGDTESRFLFHASHDENTFDSKVRFRENMHMPCYLQLSELTVNEDGDASNCSHLYRDGVGHTGLNISDMSLSQVFFKAKDRYAFTPLHDKCKYGCNKKLVAFNKKVEYELYRK
jgi:MoaA/NifB/PqqE/SkfB family radical SAM enzyme